MCLLSFLCLTHSVQSLKRIQGNSSLGMRSCLSLFSWLQGVGRAERLGFPEKRLSLISCVWPHEIRRGKVFLDVSGNGWAILAYFCSPACWGDIAVGWALQEPCQALQVTPRAPAAPASWCHPDHGENWRAGSGWKGFTPPT